MNFFLTIVRIFSLWYDNRIQNKEVFMETAIHYSQKELVKMEIRDFLNEGLQDIRTNKLLDFDTTFDELEERYHVNE